MSPKLDLQIDYRTLSELRENPANAKIHPKKQLAQVVRSIRSFGFLSPMLIDATGMILCGHARFAAAKELKLDEVPTVCVDHLTEAQRRAFEIADNKCAEGGSWSEEQLAIEFEALLNQETDFEIIDTGFTIGEVDTIIESQHKPKTPAERPFVPDRVDAVCKPGDLWIMGEHRLFNGDALDPVSYRVLLGRERAAMVFTDPPYNLQIPDVVSGLGKVRHENFAVACGEMSREEFRDFLLAAIRCMVDVTNDGSIHYICMDWRQIELLISAGREVYSELKAICVWDKQSAGMGSLYRNRHELVAVFKVGSAPHTNHVQLGANGRNRTTIWSYPGMAGFGRGRAEKLSWHPTVKNTEMVADAILDCSDPGSIILDPFAGSGTLALAAQRSRRRAALIELDPHYCDVILRRFCDATGIEPYNAWTGEIVKRKPFQEASDV
jgi:DNA modification methylase